MIKQKECVPLITLSIIFAFSITLLESSSYFLYVLAGIFIILLLNTLIKKITAYYLESEIEIKMWEFKRYGYQNSQKLKRPFPAGAFFPLISRVLFFPLNGFIWMASLVFDVKSKTYKAAKRHGQYSYSEINESDIGLIAATGIFANLLLAFLFYLVGFSEFAKFSIWYAFFNLIPLSNLDGNKIFFGSSLLWSILSTITLIALSYSFFII